MPLSRLIYAQTVRDALLEDIATGDITTESTVPADAMARAFLIAKSRMVVCGTEIAKEAFLLIDSSLTFETLIGDGSTVSGHAEQLALVSGRAASILTAERVALNFFQRLTGVSTLTASFVREVSGTKAKIVDTRKTTPGLRVLEKYAVRVGGASNHRFGLSDGVLIKDNHIVAAGGIVKAIEAARTHAPHTLKIEVEVKALSQIAEALAAGADIILLDNMSNDELRRAVATIAGRAITEASGGVTLTSVRSIAETGVDLISVGALTHSAPAADISLDFVAETAL